MTDTPGPQPDHEGRQPALSGPVHPSSVRANPVTTAPERLSWLKWIDRLSTLMAVLGGVATVGLMINVVLDVIGRYFYNQPLPGTLDLTQFAWMPTLVSLGLAYAMLRGEHIQVSLLTAPTGPRTQRIIDIVAMASTLTVTTMLLWFGAEKAGDAMGFEERAVGTPWLEIWPFRWVIVVGLAALLLQTLASLLRVIADPASRFIADESVPLVSGATALSGDELAGKTTEKASTP